MFKNFSFLTFGRASGDFFNFLLFVLVARTFGQESIGHYSFAICYMPMAKGFMYLIVILDWYARRVLAWRVSNTLGTEPCVAAREEALARYGAPEIFNTGQGAQYTSEVFTAVLLEYKVTISMDGKGRWGDNVFVERLWRSVKYEDIYLRAMKTRPYEQVSPATSSSITPNLGIKH